LVEWALCLLEHDGNRNYTLFKLMEPLLLAAAAHGIDLVAQSEAVTLTSVPSEVRWWGWSNAIVRQIDLADLAAEFTKSLTLERALTFVLTCLLIKLLGKTVVDELEKVNDSKMMLVLHAWE
jgi:hypothetical protein